MQIDRITYSPRNRDNYIRPGDVFELFYCDREWKSAGVVHALNGNDERVKRVLGWMAYRKLIRLREGQMQ